MIYFKAFTFNGRRSANKAFNTIEDNSDMNYVWADDVAEISVNSHGHYRVHSTWAQDSRNVPGGIGYGALCGGFIGLLFGPAGAIAGAGVGGSIGGLFGHHENVKFNDPVLADFAASLAPDTSALVLLGDEAIIADFTRALSVYKAVAFETQLDEAAEKALKKAMKK
jgi:uncharacterized membrane protein